MMAKAKVILLSLIVIIVVFIVILYLYTLSVRPGVLESLGFRYKSPILIKENSGKNLVDYQVLVRVNTQALILQGKMREDCGDIRFTYIHPNKGEIKIPYWIEEGCNTNDTKIWVKVPFIPANGTAVIYMYYGNPNATSESNGSEVFIFFEDFENGNLSDWSAKKLSGSIGNVTTVIGEGYNSQYAVGIKLEDLGGYYASTGVIERVVDIDCSDGCYIDAKIKWSGGGRRNYDNAAVIIEGYNGTHNKTVSYQYIKGSHPCGNYWDAFNGDCGEIDFGCTSKDVWQDLSRDVVRDFRNLCNFNLIKITKISLAVGDHGTTIYLYADNIRIRKYTYPEPSVILR